MMPNWSINIEIARLIRLFGILHRVQHLICHIKTTSPPNCFYWIANQWLSISPQMTEYHTTRSVQNQRKCPRLRNVRQALSVGTQLYIPLFLGWGRWGEGVACIQKWYLLSLWYIIVQIWTYITGWRICTVWDVNVQVRTLAFPRCRIKTAYTERGAPKTTDSMKYLTSSQRNMTKHIVTCNIDTYSCIIHAFRSKRKKNSNFSLTKHGPTLNTLVYHVLQKVSSRKH